MFILQGFDNPLGRYPAPLIPIGFMEEGEEGRTWVAHHRSGRVYIEEFTTTRYVHLSKALQVKLAGFDPEKEVLFGDSDTEVDRYPLDKKAEYFLGRFKGDPDFCKQDKSLRWMLAEIAGIQLESIQLKDE